MRPPLPSLIVASDKPEIEGGLSTTESPVLPLADWLKLSVTEQLNRVIAFTRV